MCTLQLGKLRGAPGQPWALSTSCSCGQRRDLHLQSWPSESTRSALCTTMPRSGWANMIAESRVLYAMAWVFCGVQCLLQATCIALSTNVLYSLLLRDIQSVTFGLTYILLCAIRSWSCWNSGARASKPKQKRKQSMGGDYASGCSWVQYMWSLLNVCHVLFELLRGCLKYIAVWRPLNMQLPVVIFDFMCYLHHALKSFRCLPDWLLSKQCWLLSHKSNLQQANRR